MREERPRITIPARVTASQLAAAIGSELPAVAAALRARGEPNGPDDLLESDVAIETAGALGHSVAVEPRDLALERLYEAESRFEQDPEEGLPARARKLVAGVTATAESLDEEIEAASQHWSVARMPMIDRAILRLGLWELKYEPEVPVAVVVSEAVRLANTYSTGKSGSFVNGVLATLAKSTRPE